MTTAELKRRQEDEMWETAETSPFWVSGGKKQLALERGQREEAAGTRPEGAKVKFIKVTSGVHVQTRGPVLLVREEPELLPTEVKRPWHILCLPGDERITWKMSREQVLSMVLWADLIGGPWDRISTAKQQARKLIREAEGRLGS